MAHLDVEIAHQLLGGRLAPSAADIAQQHLETCRRCRELVARERSLLKMLDLDDQPVADPISAKQMDVLASHCAEFEIRCYPMGDPNQGVVHVIGPEQGLTQPGMTIVCGDSHTSTHGAFGALAFGIGTSEVEHVLATQCLLQSKPLSYEIRIDGSLHAGVTAKDLILAVIAEIGVRGGVGHVFEIGRAHV